MTTRLLRRLSAALTITSIVLLASLPAGAETSGGLGLAQPSADAGTSHAGTSLTGGLASAGADAPALSLTAALLAAQANGTGVDLGSYLRLRSSELDAALGTPGLGLGTAGSFGALNSKLGTASFGGAFAGQGSLDELMASLARAAGTPDATSVAGGIDLARSLGQLSSPSVAMPQLGSASTILSARPDELAFGLFANQSLARAVKSSPNLLAEVQGGQLSASSMAAFQGSLQAAAASFSGGIGAALPSPCYAGMMLAVAGGAQAQAGSQLPKSCAPCITAGSYLHGRVGDLLQTGKYTPNASDGTITPYEWANMDPNSRKAVLELNPQLERQINQVTQRHSTQPAPMAASSCAAAAAGTTNFLGGNLGGILSRLGG